MAHLRPFALTLVVAVACGDSTSSSTDGADTDAGSTGEPATTGGVEPTTATATVAGTDTAGDDATGTTAAADDTASEPTSGGDTESDTTGAPAGSRGCGQAAPDAAGGVNVTIDVGPAGDGVRKFHLSRSPDYDPSVPHRLVFGFPGTDWVGEMIAPYLGLEGDTVEPRPDEIFVYPDPLWRDFEGWGNLGGWLLGPHAAPADGDADLVFVEAVIAYMESNYCIDSARIFATGHSWGGDMAQVVSCFMADRFRATVPVAANSPYWFEDGGQFIDCPGDTAVWTMFGQADEHFNSQDPGLECRDFWLDERGCAGVDQAVALDLGDAPDECVEYQGCSATTRFCLYGAQYGHQIPADYFAAATMAFFRSF